MATVVRMQTETLMPSGPASRRAWRGGGTGGGFHVLADRTYARSLSTLIESEIIPRLMMAHAAEPQPVAAVGPEASISPADIEALAAFALEVEADTLLDRIDSIIARGVTIDSVMVDLLAPTARLLGEYWESDRCDFIDVTMGLWRLQEAVHEVAARVPADRLLAAGGHRALFAAMPGDQHNFGTVVIDELFRRGGWMTERMGEAETSDLLGKVGGTWYDLVGLTVSCDCHIATLASVIAALRTVSRNPRVRVMVGGRVFCDAPELAAHVGADGTANDARLALKVADDLVRVHEEDALLAG